MAQESFYLLILLCTATGFLLIQVMARICRRRKRQCIERGIAKYLRERAAGCHQKQN